MRVILVLMLLVGSVVAAFAENVPELDVVAKNLPAYNLAYVRTVGAYGDPEVIGTAFEKVCAWAEEKGLIGDSTVVIGVSRDDPGMVPMEECRYDAAVTVPDGTEGEGDVGVYKLPAGRYAVYTAGGSHESIGEDLEKIYGDLMAWWPTGGYEVDERPWLELYYGTKEDYEAGKFVVDICVPIKGD
jgi:AraC family transcriptional regulator